VDNSLEVPEGGEEMPHVAKFRCWHKVRRDMCPCSLVADGAGVVTDVQIISTQRFFPLESVVLMQFTGYKDEDGRDIYDGDVLAGESDTVEGGDRRRVYWGYFEDCCVNGHTWLLTGNKWMNSVYEHHDSMRVVGDAYQGIPDV